MRNITKIATAAGLALASAAAVAAPDPQDFAQIERGRYLTVAGDCEACHTKLGDGQPFAGGRPIETPFGKILSSNITPDSATGIGTMSDAQFVDALTKAADAKVADAVTAGKLTQAQAAKVDAALPARLTKAVDKVR